MKFEIEMPVSELKRAVPGLAKLNHKSTLPVLRCVLLARTESGAVTITATDLDSVASYRAIESSTGPAGEMLIPWEALTKATKITKERIVFIQENDQTVLVRFFIGSMSFDEPTPTEPVKEWPLLPRVQGPEIPLSPEFKTAFAEAMSCSSSDASRFVLQGVCLDLRGGDGHYVVATDGRRLYAANTFRFDLPQSIIIPNRKFLNWSGFSDDGDWSLRFQADKNPENGGWVEIHSDRWSFVTKLIGGEYPNWKQIFPGETNPPSASATLNPEAVKTLLETLPAVRTGDNCDQSACFSIRENGIFLHGRRAPAEPWIDVPIPGASVFGPSCFVLINKEQFTQALRMGFREIELRDVNTPIVFRAPGKQFAISPTRGAVPTTPAEEVEPSASEPSTTMTKTERNPVNTTATNAERPKTTATPEQPETELRAAMLQVESVRNTFRESLNGLNQVMNLLKAAEKEQKNSDKEIESVRSTLRSLQRVQI